jgi:hypothetical protein
MCVLFLLAFFWKRLTELVRNVYVISKGLGAIRAKIGPTSNVTLMEKKCFQYLMLASDVVMTSQLLPVCSISL